MSGRSTEWLTPFLAGAATAIAAVHIYKQLKSNVEKLSSSKTLSSSLSKTVSSSSSSSSMMDSPKLDQRILRKAEGALQNRTSRLIIVVERCTNDHNYSAILRTAEALGIQHVWIISPQSLQRTLQLRNNNHSDDNSDEVVEKGELYRSTGQKVKQAAESEVRDRAMHHLFAQRATEWLSVREFDTTKECIAALRNDGYAIWTTDLSQLATCLTMQGLASDSNCHSNTSIIPNKLAIVFGTEAVGCTAEILQASDKRVYLPLRGFADSLNLSVATALVVHQLLSLDPTLIGAMSQHERNTLRKQWYTKLASQRLLTHAEKATRRRLQSKLQKCQDLQWKKQAGHTLQTEQINKLQQLPQIQQQLKLMDEQLHQRSLRAVQDLLLNPPKPITDMRRADQHRTTYVSKNTKKMNKDAWKDMPATMHYDTAQEQFSTATFFRDRANQADKADQSS